MYICLQVVYFLSIVSLQIFLLTSNSPCYSCFSKVREGKEVFLRYCKILFATARRCESSRTSSEMELLGVRETSAGTRQDAKEEAKPGPVLCGFRKRTAPDAHIAKSSPFLSGDMHNERKFDAPFERYNSNLTNYRGSLILCKC